MLDLVGMLYPFGILFSETEGQQSQRQKLPHREKPRPHRGEAKPLERDTPPRKKKETDHHQGQPTEPTEPRTTPTSPTKNNPQTTKSPLKEGKPPYLLCLVPVPFHVHILSSTKHIPSAPGFVKTLEHC